MEMEVSISLHWLPGHLQCKEETIISILFFWGQGFFHSNNSSVRHYALIQKLIPGHKMKTVLMPNSLNSEIINTPIMLQVLQVHASILSICVWTGMKAHDSFTIVSYMYLILKIKLPEFKLETTHIASTCISFKFSWTF